MTVKGKELDDVYWLFRSFGVRRLAGVSGIAAEASIIVPAHFIVLAVMGPRLTLVYVLWLAERQREREREKYWIVKNSWMTKLVSRTSKTHTNSTRFMKQSELWKHSQSSGRVQFGNSVSGSQLHFQQLWRWKETREGSLQICSWGKPPMQPLAGLTAALSLQHRENNPIKRAPNHRAISGTATWIHQRKVPLTQPAGFMAPPIKPAPDRGGEEKITTLPLSERRSFK